MELVIKIPEEVVKNDDYVNYFGVVSEKLVETIKNGTPLAKGHGRLIDADRLRSMYSINRANFNTVVGIQKWIDDATTIIEADKEQENGK